MLQVPPHGNLGHPSVKSLCLCELHDKFSFRLNIWVFQDILLSYNLPACNTERNIYKSSHSDRNFHKVSAPMSKKHRSENTIFLSLILWFSYLAPMSQQVFEYWSFWKPLTSLYINLLFLQYMSKSVCFSFCLFIFSTSSLGISLWCWKIKISQYKWCTVKKLFLCLQGQHEFRNPDVNQRAEDDKVELHYQVKLWSSRRKSFTFHSLSHSHPRAYFAVFQ